MGGLGWGRVPAWCDRLLDGVLVLLATWTVAYHVCLLVHPSVVWALGLTVVAVVGWVLVHRSLGRGAPEDGDAVPEEADDRRPGSLTSYLRSRWVLLTVVAAAVAAIGMATDAPWPLVWIPWLVAAAAGTRWAAGRLGAFPVRHGNASPTGRWTVVAVIAWALAMAAVSLSTLRPSPDDLFYVNYSQWIATHGTFPLRDTIFADLTYPMANWPPIASYDGLVGATAWLTGTHAGTVEYILVPPVASFLSVLALWRLLRAWRAPHVAVVLSVALVFLLFDGAIAYATPGGLFVTRLWQGKIILLCLVIPLLLVHALRYVDRPSRQQAFWLFTGGLAAVALSTTAIFLVPVVAVAGAAPLIRRSWRRALGGFAALAAYPLGAGIVTKALGGHSADDFGARRLYRFDGFWIGHAIFLTGFVAVIAVLAVLLGALLIPHRAARVTTGLLTLAFGLVLVPGVTRAAYDVIGLGPTLWRLSWACTIAALVGLAVVRLASLLPGRQIFRLGGVAVITVALLALLGTPVWSGSAGAEWKAPFHWQRSHSSRAVAARLIAAVRPGGLILAPDSVAITVAVTTTEVKTVAPRDYYMYYLRDVPSFHYPARIYLVRFANSEGHWRQPVLDRALRTVGVDVACVAQWDLPRVTALSRAGMVPLLRTTYYTCLHRP